MKPGEQNTVYHAILGAALALGIVVVGMTAAGAPDFEFPLLVPEPHPFERQEQRAVEQGRRINVNTATAAELEALPNIGPKLAQTIVEYREKNGRFHQRKDIMKVKGIGEKTYEKLKDMIEV